MPRLLKDLTIMKYFNKYYQPAEDLQFFSRTSLLKLFENAGYAVYLLADESNPNNSPFIGIEHVDDINGYISYPEVNRSSRGFITILVNGRYVKNTNIIKNYASSKNIL